MSILLSHRSPAIDPPIDRQVCLAPAAAAVAVVYLVQAQTPYNLQRSAVVALAAVVAAAASMAPTYYFPLRILAQIDQMVPVTAPWCSESPDTAGLAPSRTYCALGMSGAQPLNLKPVAFELER